MRVTIYSVKGGEGKTPFAVNIVLERGWAIGTNEHAHILESFIPDERLLAVPMEEAFPEIPDDIDIVFDLAGSLSSHSHSITSAIEQSDLVIVPMLNKVKSIAAGLHTIEEISEFTKSILVVATDLTKQRGEVFKTWSSSQDYKNIQKHIQNQFDFDIPILPLKHSTALERIFEDELSINQLMANDALLARSFKDVGHQFDAILEHIEEVRRAK